MTKINGVIQVGKGGRGFVVQGRNGRFVITAGHCLPKLPPYHGASYAWERTFKKLLGPLKGSCTVWAECLYADPIADIAVLGSPDNQELSEEADAYEALVGGVAPLPIARPPLTQSPRKYKLPDGSEHSVVGPLKWEGDGRLLSLAGRWFRCRLIANSRGLAITKTNQPIEGGMSGSPILTDKGAVGVVCLGSGKGVGPLNPFLVRNLPGWLLDEFGIL